MKKVKTALCLLQIFCLLAVLCSCGVWRLPELLKEKLNNGSSETLVEVSSDYSFSYEEEDANNTPEQTEPDDTDKQQTENDNQIVQNNTSSKKNQTTTSSKSVTNNQTTSSRRTTNKVSSATGKSSSAANKPSATTSSQTIPVYNISKLAQSKKTITAATIKTYSGSISFEDEVDTYTYQPARDGRYRFELSGVKSGIVFEMAIYNSLGEELKYDNYAINGDGITIDLTKGKTYTYKIFQDNNFGNYTLSVGEQAATTNISAYSSVSDSVVYNDQINIYTFTPQRDGRYRFELSGVKSGIVLEMAIYNSLEEELKYDNYAINGDGLTVDLKKGETYTYKIFQDNNFGNYTLNIGKQKETTSITTNCIVNDSIEFNAQRNIYTFTAKKSGNLNIKFTQITSGVIFEAYVLNDLDETIKSDNYCINGDSLTLTNLNAGETYTIIVYQDNGLGSYRMTLSS